MTLPRPSLVRANYDPLFTVGIDLPFHFYVTVAGHTGNFTRPKINLFAQIDLQFCQLTANFVLGAQKIFIAVKQLVGIARDVKSSVAHLVKKDIGKFDIA